MKIKALLLISLTALLLIGCNNNNVNDTEEMNNVADKPVGVEQDSYSKDSFDIDWNSWGVVVADTVKGKDGKEQPIEIKFPTDSKVKDTVSGISSYTENGKLVIYDAYVYSENEYGGSPEVEGDTLENVITSYFSQTLAIINETNPKNEIQSLIIGENKPIKVNEYNTHKSIGAITGIADGKEFEWECVAFATKLKSNGAYVYVYVIDTTEDNKLQDTLADDAVKMMLTLQEITSEE